jgi:hypothetical protein
MNQQSQASAPDLSDVFIIKFTGRVYTLTAQTALLFVISAAVLMRVFSAVYQGNSVTDLPGVYDQISYDSLARRIMDGHGFSFAEDHWPATRGGEPTAHWSFLYTLYLAAVYTVSGLNPLVARLIQAVVAGIFHPLLVWRIANQLFNRTVGLVAAILTAGYAYFFYYAGSLVTESFYIIAILWVFDVSIRLVAEQKSMPVTGRISLWRWIELGFAIGIAVLLRQVFFIFLPFLFFWLWWNFSEAGNSKWEKRLHWSAVKGLSVSTLVLAILILPWTYRNQKAFGTFVLLNTNAGYAFFWGNHPIYGTDFIPLLAPEMYNELIPRELLPLNEAKLDKTLLQMGIQFVIDDPARIFLLSINRAEEFFKFWPTTSSGLISNISRVGSFGITLPFMVFGIWVVLASEYGRKTESQKAGILLLLIFTVVYIGVHLASWALIRYRLPADAVLLIFGAFGMTRVIHGKT